MSAQISDIPPLDFAAGDLNAALSAAAQCMAGSDGKISINPETLERDLAKLVLVVVELLRRLMEHQALARMDRGTLTDRQIDALSDGLFRAQAKIDEMREAFGIAPEDFNIELGPLGKVL